ncbi:MAG: zinc dependent phospholipase C family protein [Desulfomonilia bacterium]
MPKENTHLYFAHRLLEDFRETELLREISLHIDSYYLGSIIPDTFFYSSNPALEAVSEFIHGKEGNPTNTMILDVLDRGARGNDLVLILGFITHCALDIVFHPVIYYLSGNYYDTDPERKSRAAYMHRHIETCLDISLGNTMRLHERIRPHVMKGLIFEQRVSDRSGVPGTQIRRTILKQILINRLFESRSTYRLACLLARKGIVFKDTSKLGLFYGDVTHPGKNLEQVFPYRDLFSGEELETSFHDLFGRARKMAAGMVEAAYLFSKGQISRDHLIERIPGQSLDTGVMHTPTETIRYTTDITGHQLC